MEKSPDMAPLTPFVPVSALASERMLGALMGRVAGPQVSHALRSLQFADRVLGKLGIKDPLLDIAKELEEAALKDSYFVERKLYPNVDFYSGIIYRALGFPTSMFTVLFAIGRLPGWIAHWKEMMEDPTTKIGRPRQIYTGPTIRDYVPIDQRTSGGK